MSLHHLGAGLLACMLGIAPALAQAPGAPPGTGGQGRAAPGNTQGAQQERMRACNADVGARRLQGDARRDFMSECMAGRTGAGATVAPPATGGGPAAPRPGSTGR